MLGETGIAQWRGDLMLLGRPLAGAEVAPVVEVHTVGDRIEAAPAAKFLHRREQFVLAMKAAGSVIAGIFRPVELAGHDDFEGISCSAAKAVASASWVRAKLGESAMTASILLPNTWCAAQARNAESTPPE